MRQIASKMIILLAILSGLFEQEYKKKIDLTIYCNEDINVPFVIGLRKPSIFINPKIFSKLQLYYIFKHEIVHIVNRDNWIKMFIHVFVLLVDTFLVANSGFSR